MNRKSEKEQPRRAKNKGSKQDEVPENTAEANRLRLMRDQGEDWYQWGPYLSERQWGTVREDYSNDGAAWDSFTHDMARSRAYRWGEDGIAGISDKGQHLCLSIALWNEQDSILKERLFGLTNSEGNHGEDVKELYYYLDATPTHSYLKMLYKYPQSAFPYQELIDENQKRGVEGSEYELVDTGVFNEGRYFDVFVEYAKDSPEDILMRVSVHNRGPVDAKINLMPQIWFRNTWAWSHDAPKPSLSAQGTSSVLINHSELQGYRAYFDGNPELIFCDNETNVSHLYGQESEGGYFKDAFHEYVVDGNEAACNPDQKGTKAAARYVLNVPAGDSVTVQVRLCRGSFDKPFKDYDTIMATRKQEADAFYSNLQQSLNGEDVRRVHRQSLAGMIWSKQFYHFDIPKWLEGDETQVRPPEERLRGRNSEWGHLNNADIISMPDKWEYPWYASWDLAFHCIPLAMVDAEFAKGQLDLLTREWYMHPNGQLPAYEWNFSDVNPPVHAWSTWRVFEIDREQQGGVGDLAFLERVFHKLLLNFTWWVNRKDEEGHNIFQGGFLGLDNIGLFDRSAPLPTGGHIHQSDGTSWMAMYCLNLMRIALELARHNPVYQDIATKFLEHFLHIAEAMTNMGGEHIGLWDEEDQFFYDKLHLSNGKMMSLRIRSLVGLIPLFAVETIEPELLDELPEFKARLEWFMKYRPDLASLVSRWEEPGRGERRLLSLLRGHRMKALLRRMLDEGEFLSDYGIRALSRAHNEHPYNLHLNGETFSVSYEPGESDTTLFGGNSNWRGPIWFPVNYLIIESLRKFHDYYGDDFKVEYPTGSGQEQTILDIAGDIARRLTNIFIRTDDDSARRPVFGDTSLMQNDPHFRDHLLFFEYFHGDTGRGVGASHQTGWTGLIAPLLEWNAGLSGSIRSETKVQTHQTV